MKKKMVSILTAAFCASALLAGCGSADTAKTSASSAGAASSSADGTTTFTVGFDAEYPPYGYMDDETGNYTGFDLELAEAVCEIYGWKLYRKKKAAPMRFTDRRAGAKSRKKRPEMQKFTITNPVRKCTRKYKKQRLSGAEKAGFSRWGFRKLFFSNGFPLADEKIRAFCRKIW